MPRGTSTLYDFTAALFKTFLETADIFIAGKEVVGYAYSSSVSQYVVGVMAERYVGTGKRAERSK